MSQGLTKEQLARIEENRRKALAIQAERRAAAASCQPGPSTATAAPTPVASPKQVRQEIRFAPYQKPASRRGGRFPGFQQETSAQADFSWKLKKNAGPSVKRVNGTPDVVVQGAFNATSVSLSLTARDSVSVICPYNKEVIDACKTIASRRYEPDTKRWSFPLQDYDKIASALQPLATSGKIKLSPLPPAVMQLFGHVIKGNAAQTGSSQANYDPDQIDLTKRIPAILVDQLYEFQREGVRRIIAKHGRALLADEMGLGKTVQAALVASFYTSDWPLLVVCPSSMRYSWEESLLHWVPDIRRDRIHVLESGKDPLPSTGQQTAAICSYDIAVLLKADLAARKFGIIILDESHFVKNYKTKRYKAVESITKKAKRLLLLTGTPALSRPEELYCQVSLVKPGFFGQFMDFGLRYCDAKRVTKFRCFCYFDFIWGMEATSNPFTFTNVSDSPQTQWAWDFSGASNTEELCILLEETVMIRRLKKDVMDQLPSKSREMVVLDKSSVRTNLKALQQAAEEARNATAGEQHQALLRYFHQTAFAKVDAVRSFILDLLGGNDTKILVFAHHTAMLDDLAMNLAQKKIQFIRIDGKTPSEARKRYVDEFQSHKEVRVAILSILAANAGLTLTAASVVVFAELYWNPGTLIQAEDRVHRVGQSENVQIKYLVAKGTADDCLWPLVKKKLSVLGKVGLNKESFSDVASEFLGDTPDELAELVSRAKSDSKSIAKYFKKVGENSDESDDEEMEADVADVGDSDAEG